APTRSPRISSPRSRPTADGVIQGRRSRTGMCGTCAPCPSPFPQRPQPVAGAGERSIAAGTWHILCRLHGTSQGEGATMQYDPKDAGERTGGASQAGAQSGAAGGGQDRLEADLGDTTGDRSASAFSDTSGTLGRESLGGAETGARKTAGEAKERIAQVKEKASTFRATLADKLESGAERLRQRAASASGTEAPAQAEERMRKMGGKMAAGM